MPESDDLPRALRSWLRDEAAPHSPADLFETVVVETRSLRPRAAWLATLRGDGLRDRRIPEIPTRTAIVLALVALALAVIGVTMLAGGSVRPLPHPLTGLRPSPALAASTDPILELPAGLSHSLGVAEVEQAVVAEMRRGSAGLVTGPIVLRRVTLVPPNASYAFGTPDANGNRPGSMSEEQAFWVVEADGTGTICSSFCDASDRVIVVMDDAGPKFARVSGYQDQSRVYPIPAPTFRETLAGHGLAYMPAEVPVGGVLDAAAVMTHLDRHRFPALAGRQGPVFGTIVVADPALAAQAGSIPLSPSAGASRPIWFVQLMEKPWSWAVVDAVTGSTLESGSSMS